MRFNPKIVHFRTSPPNQIGYQRKCIYFFCVSICETVRVMISLGDDSLEIQLQLFQYCQLLWEIWTAEAVLIWQEIYNWTRCCAIKPNYHARYRKFNFEIFKQSNLINSSNWVIGLWFLLECFEFEIFKCMENYCCKCASF